MLKNRPLFGPAVPRAFYARDVRAVARELLGLILVRRQGAKLQAGRIVEVEAYGRQGDRASHATSGKTPRNAVMFGPPGHAYVYFTYGMHWLLNVVCETAGTPAAVLIRGVELLPSGSRHEAVGSSHRYPTAYCQLPTAQLNGPAKLTQAFHITGALNGEDLITSRQLWIEPPRGTARRERIVRTPRIGVNYAGRASRWRRRFVLATAARKAIPPARKKNWGSAANRTP